MALRLLADQWVGAVRGERADRHEQRVMTIRLLDYGRSAKKKGHSPFLNVLCALADQEQKSVRLGTVAVMLGLEPT